MRLLVEAQVPDADWRKAYRLALAQLRTEVNLHPRGATPAALFEAAAKATRTVSAECLPLGMGLVMHLYPLCALRCVPLPWWSPANLRRHRLLGAIHRNGLMLANAGSERVQGAQAPVHLTKAASGVLVEGTFDYVSLASTADLVLFSAPLLNGASLFCIADLRADTVRIGEPRFPGTMKLADTCSVSFKDHHVPDGRFVVIPNDTALGCMTQFQRSWFQLLAGEAHLARLEFLQRRWQLPRSPEELASFNELRLMREYAVRLLNEAAKAGGLEPLSRVTAALKLRISWHCQAMATALRGLDATSAAELGFLKRQPTSDERILQGLTTPSDPRVTSRMSDRATGQIAGGRVTLAPG